MQINERLRMLLEATPVQLAAIDAALAGQSTPEAPSLRLYRMGEAAEKTGLSRTTLWRCIKAGRIQTVEVREGSLRIPEDELRRFVAGQL